MPSAYLAGSDKAAYGVPNATDAQIATASALVDAYLKRPEGLQWNPDYAGFPCYMAGLTAKATLKSTQAIAVGSGVVVPMPFPAGMQAVCGVGDVAIIDRANTSAVEACVVQSVSPAGIVFQGVTIAHAANATIEFGLAVREQRSLPAKRSVTMVGSCPVVRLLSGVGSYRYGRRSQQTAGMFEDQAFLQMVGGVGGPPEWMLFDTAATDVNGETGEIWIPAGTYLANFSDVRLAYVAGFGAGNIPSIIKSVTAVAITGSVNAADLVGGIKMIKAGDTTIERFANSVLDADMRQQLEMYKARQFA